MTAWLPLRDCPQLAFRALISEGLGETGSPFRIVNYLKRVLKPLATTAGIPDLTYQAIRGVFSALLTAS